LGEAAFVVALAACLAFGRRVGGALVDELRLEVVDEQVQPPVGAEVECDLQAAARLRWVSLNSRKAPCSQIGR
jgi:hypothetical protein